MTNEEALKLSIQLRDFILNDIHYNNDYAEAIRIGVEALEKQIPKKPIKDKEPRYGMGNEYHDWICPNCGKWLAYQPDYHRYEIHHCYCGQKIDWGNEE